MEKMVLIGLAVLGCVFSFFNGLLILPASIAVAWLGYGELKRLNKLNEQLQDINKHLVEKTEFYDKKFEFFAKTIEGVNQDQAHLATRFNRLIQNTTERGLKRK